MKDLNQYGNRRDEEWDILPWIPDPRPPFKIWVKPEQITPFFLIPHHPYAISLLLKIGDGFRAEEFCRLGLTGSSGDWERLVRGVIWEFEENNSGEDLFHFDSDEDVFCVYSQYIDDLMMLAKMIRAACSDEKTMRTYLDMAHWKEKQCTLHCLMMNCWCCMICSRLEDAEGVFEDMAEQQVLWHIQTQLEKELVEPFQANYLEALEATRRTVREKY